MKKAFLVLLVLIPFFSCNEIPDYLFKNKVNGHRPFGLEGVYVFSYPLPDSVAQDTVKFERVKKNEFVVTNFSSNDTLYFGEIVKRKGMYFLNKMSDERGWWNISAFKFVGDSVHNYGALNGANSYPDETKEEKIFSDYIETEHAVYINNSSVETYEAMKSAVAKGFRVGCKELGWNEEPNSESNDAGKEPEEEIGIDPVLVYPNPVKENLVIETKSDGNFLFEIIDMNGKLIRSEKFSESFVLVNMTGVANGNYLARITDLKKNSYKSRKIMVAK